MNSSLLFLGDDRFTALQDRQYGILSDRGLSAVRSTWQTGDPAILETLTEQSAEIPLTIVASRLGAVPAVAWTAQNPNRTRRLILLHPSLHLSIPEFGPAAPHFVPTLVIHQSKLPEPSLEVMSSLARALFHDHSLHSTAEPDHLPATLALLNL